MKARGYDVFLVTAVACVVATALMSGAAAAPVCGATGSGSSRGFVDDCQEVVSYLSTIGARGTLCGAEADNHDAQGCTNMASHGTCAGNICGDSSASSGISCTTVANYISSIISDCTSSGSVHGTVTTAENPLVSIVVQHA